MRLFQVLLATRTGKSDPVPFQEILPMKLRPVVSGKGNKTSEVSCLHEMSLMLACFKTNEFDQSLCNKEVANFQRCYVQHLDTKRVKKEKEERGILTPGEKNMSAKQVNILLKKFPNFK